MYKEAFPVMSNKPEQPKVNGEALNFREWNLTKKVTYNKDQVEYNVMHSVI
jgi:hypothetical protein